MGYILFNTNKEHGMYIDSTNVLEHAPGEMTAEASELRILPGHVPHVIETNIGNGRPFRLIHANPEKFVYRQENGCVDLTIYND